jgi:hypothetical protein
MEGSRSTLSPKVYGKGGPLAIAEATADLRNSMVLWADVWEFVSASVVRTELGGRFFVLVAGCFWFKKEAIANERASCYRAACLAR